MVRALLKGSKFVTERGPEEIAPHGRLSQRALDLTQELMDGAGQLERTFTHLEVNSPEFFP